MNTKIKLLSAVTIILMGSSAFANDEGEWSTNNLKNYNGGDIVSIDGKKFQCTRDIHASKWCQLAAYKPTGIYGGDAWKEISNSNPNPTPEPQPEPTPTPEPQPNPEPAPQPNPDSSSCGKIPGNVKEFVPQGPQNWNGYVKDAFIKFEGAIYKLTDWWSASSPKQDSDWKLCEASKPAEQGNLSIVVNKQTFSDSNKPEIIIFKVEGNKKVEIAKVSEYEYGKEINLPVSTGDLEVFVSSVNGSTANISPASISLAKDQTKNVEINLEAPAPAETGQLEISFKNIAQASESVHYTISDSDGHIVRNGHTDFSSPVVFSDLPASDNGVKYTVSFDDYISNGTMYKAKDVTVTVFKHNTTKLDYEFTATPIAAQNVNINLSGLPEDKTLR